MILVHIEGPGFIVVRFFNFRVGLVGEVFASGVGFSFTYSFWLDLIVSVL